MNYFLLAISVFLAVSNNVLYHKLSGMGNYNRFLFTAVSSLIWLFILLPAGISGIKSGEIIFGVIYGIVQSLFLFFKMRAMSSGPISITSVVSNCSMLLTTILGIFLFSESVGFFQAVGVACILISVFMCTDAKADMEMSVKWKIYCLCFFVCAASVGIIFKYFSKTNGNGNNMMIVSAITMVLVMTGLSFTSAEKMKLSKSQLLIAFLAGLVSCGYNRLNLFLSGALPSVVFFPIFNGSIVLLCSVTGAVFFKERFSLKQLSGIIIGIIAIALIGNIIKI